MGEIFPRGSYIKHIDGATGKEEYGFIKDGTMEKDGDSYTFNLTLENNVKATLSFKGNVNLLDKRSPIVRYSTLTEDITLQLSSKLTESAAAYSENSWLENMDEWLILINNPDGDMIMIEFMTKDCNGILPEGVYTVGHTFVENEIIPGFYDTVNGALLYSWYVSNVVEVEEGVALASPINGGTLKISRKENDYTLDFRFHR